MRKEDIDTQVKCKLSPFNNSFTWQTTIITDIVEERDGYLKFKTENSVYELTNIK